MQPAVFLDRDDTLIDTRRATADEPRPGDLARPSLVRLLPGVAEACRRLADAGFLLIGISNQGAVARANATLEDVHDVNQRLLHILTSHRPVPAPATQRPFVTLPDRPSLVAAVYFCPYHPEGTVPEFAREDDWRKPAPGMVLAGAADFDVDLGRAWMVGNAERDVECGVNAGIDPDRSLRVGPDGTFPALLDATRHILRSVASNA